jgi:hypothetical protein
VQQALRNYSEPVSYLLDPQLSDPSHRARRVSLLSERIERRKKHSGTLLDESLRDQLEVYFAAIRDKFGLKRKEMEVSVESGLATLRTPHFELSLRSERIADDNSEIDWRHQVTFLDNLNVMETEAFQSVFGEAFDTLLIELATKLSVSDLVDHLEEINLPGLSLDYDSRCLWCEIQIQGFTDIIRVESDVIKITRLSVSTFRSLTEIAQKFGLPIF